MNVTKVEANSFDADTQGDELTPADNSVNRTRTSIRSTGPATSNKYDLVDAEFVTGLLGTGLAMQAPDAFTVGWESVNSQDTAPTAMVVFWRGKFNDSVASKILGSLTQGGSFPVKLETDAGGLLRLNINSAYTDADSATITTDTVYMFELGCYANNAASTVIAKLNGNVIAGLSLTNVDTNQTTVSTFEIDEPTAGNYEVDDLIIKWGDGDISESDFWTTGGAVPRVTSLRPNADGNYTNWHHRVNNVATGAGAPFYTSIDDAVYDEDGTELTIVNSFDKQSWKYEGFTEDANATIYGVLTRRYCETGSTDTAFVEAFFRDSGGSEVQHPERDQVYTGGDDEDDWPTAGLQTHHGDSELWLTHPFTGVAWTVADLADGAVEEGVWGRDYDPFPYTTVGQANITLAMLIVIWFEGEVAGDAGLYTLAQMGVDW